MGEQSGFGKGLVICLVKFAEHFERWESQKELYEEMREKSDNPEFWDISHTVEMFFYAASDHLYEIEVPKQWERKKLGRKVKELQSFGLKMGHGFDYTAKWTEDDFTRTYALCREIALLIDKELGLEPNIGQW